jgi:hypothetical protein
MGKDFGIRSIRPLTGYFGHRLTPSLPGDFGLQLYNVLLMVMTSEI